MHGNSLIWLLFKKLKNSPIKQAVEIENKIWKIWVTHPTKDRKGYRLTELLDQGSLLIDRRQLKKAYEIFSQIIAVDPKWSEAIRHEERVSEKQAKWALALKMDGELTRSALELTRNAFGGA